MDEEQRQYDDSFMDTSNESHHAPSESPPTFRDALEGNRSALVDDLEVTDEMLDLLNDRGVLTDRHVEHVQSNASRYQRVESMIPILERRDESLLPDFCDVLNETGQAPIADKLRCDKVTDAGESDAGHLEVAAQVSTTTSAPVRTEAMAQRTLSDSTLHDMLNGNRAYLVENLEVSFGLLDHLQDRGMLTSRQVEATLSYKTEYGRSEYVLQFIDRMDQSFCDVLIDTGQQATAYMLKCPSIQNKLEIVAQTKDSTTFRVMLKGYWFFTVTNLHDFQRLLDEYLQSGVLNKRHVEAIRGIKTDSESKAFMLQVMERRDPSLRPAFCRGLTTTGHIKIAEKLNCFSDAAVGTFDSLSSANTHSNLSHPFATVGNMTADPASLGYINVTLQHKQKPLIISKSWPVSRLYHVVSHFVPNDTFSLSYQGQRLIESRNISYYNINFGESVVLSVGVNGGVCQCLRLDDFGELTTESCCVQHDDQHSNRNTSRLHKKSHKFVVYSATS